MTHPNRRQVRLSAQLIDALAGVLEQALACLQSGERDHRALRASGQQLLKELRARLESDRARTEPPRRIYADDSDHYQDRLSVNAWTVLVLSAPRGECL